MYQDTPTFAILSFAIAAYLFYLWYGDLSHFKKTGTPAKGAFEGATTVSARSAVFAAACALALLAIFIAAESYLGIDKQQSKVSAWALLSWISAAVIEELIFRGYLVVRGKGAFVLWASVLFFSMRFALAHPFVWNYSVPEGDSLLNGVWIFDFSIQPIFSTFAIFACSLLFYVLRFMPSNVNRSLIPCMSAHCAYNLGVFAAKYLQGFIE